MQLQSAEPLSVTPPPVPAPGLPWDPHGPSISFQKPSVLHHVPILDAEGINSDQNTPQRGHDNAQSAPGILKYMFECLIFVLMGWIWNVMWDNWFVIQFNLIASSDERKVGIYFGGTEQKPAFFFLRSISSHPSNKYNHGSNNCLLLFVFYLVRLKKTNRKKATVRPSETIKKHQHQQQGPAVVLLSIYLFCCYVCWLSVLVEYTGCPIKTVTSQNIFLDK